MMAEASKKLKKLSTYSAFIVILAFTGCAFRAYRVEIGKNGSGKTSLITLVGQRLTSVRAMDEPLLDCCCANILLEPYEKKYLLAVEIFLRKTVPKEIPGDYLYVKDSLGGTHGYWHRPWKEFDPEVPRSDYLYVKPGYSLYLNVDSTGMFFRGSYFYKGYTTVIMHYPMEKALYYITAQEFKMIANAKQVRATITGYYDTKEYLVPSKVLENYKRFYAEYVEKFPMVPNKVVSRIREEEIYRREFIKIEWK